MSICTVLQLWRGATPLSEIITKKLDLNGIQDFVRLERQKIYSICMSIRAAWATATQLIYEIGRKFMLED